MQERFERISKFNCWVFQETFGNQLSNIQFEMLYSILYV